jgi:endonuclease/exonuclease/phosphatase family metal-dependent hydrolase
MKKMVKWTAIIVLTPVILFALYVIGMLAVGYLYKFKPQPEEAVAVTGKALPVAADSSFTFMIWNVGYGGLGAQADFFYDGGKMVISNQEDVERYTNGIYEEIDSNTGTDFILLQEVDENSKRSYNINQQKSISGLMDGYSHAFAVNYDVKYLPFPWTWPLGKIKSGLLSLSKYQPVESKRISLPGITDFPRKLFYLERCLLMQRYKLANGKELVVINTHFEAYDKGEVKKAQMALTKKYLEEEYAKGNYVVMGGDWNIAPPTFNVHTWEKEKEEDQLYLANNDPNYIPGWHYAYDSTTATNRKNKYAFDPATTFTTVIDYYMVSPNVQVDEVKGINLNFAYSDHQPVKLRVTLK